MRRLLFVLSACLFVTAAHAGTEVVYSKSDVKVLPASRVDASSLRILALTFKDASPAHSFGCGSASASMSCTMIPATQAQVIVRALYDDAGQPNGSAASESVDSSSELNLAMDPSAFSADEIALMKRAPQRAKELVQLKTSIQALTGPEVDESASELCTTGDNADLSCVDQIAYKNVSGQFLFISAEKL